MNAWILPETDISVVDKMLYRPDGTIKPVPAAVLQEIPITTIQVWCVRRGVYQIPTEELLNWLTEHIRGKNAIEIGAGNGAIGRELGIPMTDSYIQTTPAIKAYYELLKQTPITPPSDVQKFEANEAVDHFKPDLVIGAYITQLYTEGYKHGSAFGVDEVFLIDKVQKYIHIGNDASHGDKKIMQELPYVLQRFPWLVSRGMDQNLNHICIWEAEC